MVAGCVVPVSIGDDLLTVGFSHDDIGRGFKLNISPGESPFRDKIFKTSSQVVKRPQVKSQSFCEVMDSLDKVSEHMNIAGHLKVAYGPMISGEGAGKYLTDNLKNKRKAALRYRTQHVHSYSHLLLPDEGGRVLTDAVAANREFDFDRYGTLFVDQVQWGAQLDITFMVESDEEEDVSEILADLKGQIGVGVLSVGFSAKFAKKDASSRRKHRMSIKASASGVQIQVPANPSLEQVFELIADFNENYSQKVGQETDDRTFLSPIAFVLARTKDCMSLPGDLECAFIENQMASVSVVFVRASLWRARLAAAQQECEAEYNSPRDRETLMRGYRDQVKNEIKLLTEKQKECLRFRALPLKKLLGQGNEAGAPVPSAYPTEDHEISRLQGLLGNGHLKGPVTFAGRAGKIPYDYEGFLLQDSQGCLRPCLSGKLLDNGREVVQGRTPEMLADLAQAFNHQFNPELLKTRILSAEDFDPTVGDLFIPEDMRESFRNSDGDLIDPVFANKRMVIVGPQGAGKTSFFNRLTGSRNIVSKSLQTCTTSLSMANARGPAAELLIVDTPGTANSTVNGMTIDEAMELRKALVTGTVAQIVVVISFTNNERKQALSDQLAVALDSIFDCETFKRDAYGDDVTMRETKNKSSPRRTRPFLVVTHRDCSQMGREKYAPLMEELRKDFPWIGPVAFIDERVSLAWLYDTIIACAGYERACNTNYSIPLVEMFTKFKMTFAPLGDNWMNHIEEAKHEMNTGVTCAIDSINQAVREREAQGAVGGHHVDRVAPLLDCISRFVDDLYEQTTQATLARCYDESIEDLWASTNEHINNEKFNTMNVIKQHLAASVIGARKKILRHYPTAGEAAVYKKCPNCGAVYVKPTGCDYIGQCGGYGVAKDAGHAGTMKFELRYEYDRDNKRLHVREGGIGMFEAISWSMRRKLRDIASALPIHRAQYYDTSESPSTLGCLGDYGCGVELRWSSMIALSKEELQEKKLVPSGNDSEISAEPCLEATTMPIESFLQMCGPSYQDYAVRIQKYSKVKTVKDLVDLAEEEGWTETFDAFKVKTLHRITIQEKLSGLSN